MYAHNYLFLYNLLCYVTGCADVSSNCAQLNSGAHICTDSGAQLYAKQNCALTCNMCSSGQPTIPQMSGCKKTISFIIDQLKSLAFN